MLIADEAVLVEHDIVDIGEIETDTIDRLPPWLVDLESDVVTILCEVLEGNSVLTTVGTVTVSLVGCPASVVMQNFSFR